MPDVIRHWVIRRGDGSAGNFLRVHHFNEHARPFVAVRSLNGFQEFDLENFYLECYGTVMDMFLRY